MPVAQHPHPRTIKLSDIEEDDVSHIGRLLKIIGSSLEHLDIYTSAALGSIPNAPGSPLYLSDYLLDITCIIFATAQVNLADCVNLRSIEVNLGRVDQDRKSVV